MRDVYSGVNAETVEGVTVEGVPLRIEPAVDALPGVPVLQPAPKPRVTPAGKSHRRRRNSRVVTTRLGRGFASLEEMNAHVEAGRGHGISRGNTPA